MGEKYVTMYAKIKCSQGCMENYLNVGTDHGVYKLSGEGEAYPVMSAADKEVTENIPGFGKCNSLINSEFLKKTPQEQAVLKAKSAITKGGVCDCKPVIVTDWYNANTANMLDGKACLTEDSKVACVYGGIISIVKEQKEN